MIHVFTINFMFSTFGCEFLSVFYFLVHHWIEFSLDNPRFSNLSDIVFGVSYLGLNLLALFCLFINNRSHDYFSFSSQTSLGFVKSKQILGFHLLDNIDPFKNIKLIGSLRLS